MSEFFKKKRMTKLIGFGALITIAVVFGLSMLFADLKMDNVLSVFLIVLVASTVIFLYYLLFTHFERKTQERKRKFDDPFNK